MEAERNEGNAENKQGIGSSGGEEARSHLHQTASYGGEHELSYFESDVALEGAAPHSIPVIPEGSTIAKTSLPMKDTGSPPPNSATTSGSTSTPTSIGGMSAGDAPAKSVDHAPEFSRESLNTLPTSTLQPSGSSSTGEHTWSVSLSEGIMTQRYAHPAANAPADQGDSSYQQSPGGRYNPASYPSAIKLLVSNNVAGSIIGRAGQTISDLQNESSARIKLSQTGDYYPGTQDRVCLVQGQLENVKIAVRLLFERLYMLQEQQHSQHLAWQPKSNEAASPGFDFVVRLLVPSSSCGMIIGKAGSNIKSMEEASGVSSVRLSPKENTDSSSPSAAVVSGTSERVVTLTGPNMESCLKCLYIVLDGMTSHHEICRYSNMTTSYSRIVVPGSFGSVPQTGRPVLVVPPTGNPESSLWDSTGAYSTSQFMGKRSNSSPDLAGQMLWDQTGAPRVPPETTTPPVSRHLGREAMPAYNPIFNEPSQSFSHDIQSIMHSSARGPPNSSTAPPLYLLPNPSANPMEPTTMSNSASAPDLLAGQLQESLRLVASPPAPSIDYQHFAPQLPQPTPPGFTAQVLVPDTLIGSILGRGGRTLNELQMHSNTRIRISQRGEYVPGTRNRIVTIRGPTAHSVSLAQYLMSQRMVLPPTASYSPQAQYHPPQLQAQPQQRHIQHYSSQQQPSPHHRPEIQHQQFHGPHDNVFQSPDTSDQHQSASPSGNPSRPNSGKDLPHS